MKFHYKDEHPFDARKAEGLKMRRKHPDHVPAILEKHPKSSLAPLAETKFLVPGELTVGQFCHLVRRRCKLTPDEPLYFFVGGEMASVCVSMAALYAEHHEEDLMVYIGYSDEDVYEG